MSPLGRRIVSKINQLLQQWPSGTVATLRWLNSRGVDRRLANKYVQSGWLERIGHGAYKRAGATVDWAGAVHALQTQLALAVHPGGITAIELRGYTHYLSLGAREVVLFGNPGTKLPAWFQAHAWSRPVTLVTTGVFAGTERTTSTLPVDGFDLEVATLERAAFEPSRHLRLSHRSLGYRIHAAMNVASVKLPVFDRKLGLASSADKEAAPECGGDHRNFILRCMRTRHPDREDL